MNRALDIFYLSAWPLALSAIVLAVVFRQQRIFLLLSALALGAAWWGAFMERKTRYVYLTGPLPSSAAEITKNLGAPEAKTVFPEGDELWTFSVRSYPWSRVQWYSIYRGEILAGSWRDDIGVFETLQPTYTRDEKESVLTRSLLGRINQKNEN
jgi:hypothetical protein